MNVRVTLLKFLKNLNLVENQTDFNIDILVTYNMNIKLKKVLDDSGTIYPTTVRYNPQQNEFSERANRSNCEKARSMLSNACLPNEYLVVKLLRMC